MRRYFYLVMVLIQMSLPTPLPAEAPPVILCLGDSLTAGYGVSTEESYPTLLRTRLREQGYPHRVINAGLSGDTTAGGVRRLDGLLRTPPHIAIVALGANDGLRGLDLHEMKQNLATILTRLQRAGVQPILVGMRIPPDDGRPYSERFAAIYTELAQEHGVFLIPFLLEGVAGHPALNQADGLHPNAAGYRRVLENVWPLLHARLP